MRAMNIRLDRPVDAARDHVIGAPKAEITLVEYGSYDCPHCRAANARITEVRNELGERVRYVFRHRPISGSELARRAAELIEQARTPDEFWSAHVALMTRSRTLTEEDLRVVAEDLRLDGDSPETTSTREAEARARVDSDVASSHASGVRFTPTFFINNQRYDGPWDEASFTDAMLGSLGHRVRTAALEFASWAPSTGLLLLLATLLAVILTNTDAGPAFTRFWETGVGLTFGDAAFRMSLAHWVNDALLTVFFLVVGLEIKREFTVGHLATRRSAALPIAAAIGGMVVPALIYVLLVPGGPWTHGWGVPMATDTAFAVALIAVMGARVPQAWGLLGGRERELEVARHPPPSTRDGRGTPAGPTRPSPSTTSGPDASLRCGPPAAGRPPKLLIRSTRPCVSSWPSPSSSASPPPPPATRPERPRSPSRRSRWPSPG
jgi:NhaA family Na+:H+ antiporter